MTSNWERDERNKIILVCKAFSSFNKIHFEQLIGKNIDEAKKESWNNPDFINFFVLFHEKNPNLKKNNMTWFINIFNQFYNRDPDEGLLKKLLGATITLQSNSGDNNPSNNTSNTTTDNIADDSESDSDGEMLDLFG